MEFLLISLVVAGASAHAHLHAVSLRRRFNEDERRIAQLKDALHTLNPRTQ